MTSNYKIVTATATFMQDVIEASKTTPVLVDFWAAWCEPCKQLMPVLDRLADEYAGRFVLAKVDADANQELVQQMGVRSLPTVAVFKDGTVVDHFVGVVPEAQIRELLNRHVPAVQQTPLQRARDLKASGDLTGAQLLLDQELVREPNNVELQCELGEIKVLDGNIDDAKQVLANIQSREPTALPAKRLAALIEFSDVVRENPDTNVIRQRLSAEPTDLDARHALAVHRLLANDYDAALEDWLEMMRTNRKYKDDLARKSLVMAFELIGNTDPRVQQARREMARMLY
jgi:putative thioredoxin